MISKENLISKFEALYADGWDRHADDVICEIGKNQAKKNLGFTIKVRMIDFEENSGAVEGIIFDREKNHIVETKAFDFRGRCLKNSAFRETIMWWIGKVFEEEKDPRVVVLEKIGYIVFKKNNSYIYDNPKDGSKFIVVPLPGANTLWTLAAFEYTRKVIEAAQEKLPNFHVYITHSSDLSSQDKILIKFVKRII